MGEANQEPFHSLPAREVLERVASTPGGLSAAQAVERLARHGPNELPRARGRHPLERFLQQFNSALIYFLLAAALGAWVLGHHVAEGALVIACGVALMALLEGEKLLLRRLGFAAS